MHGKAHRFSEVNDARPIDKKAAITLHGKLRCGNTAAIIARSGQN